NTKPKSEFYKSLGRAISRKAPGTFPERWQGPNCILVAGFAGDRIEFCGTYEQDLSPLFSLMAGSFAAPRQRTRFGVEYSGTLRGRAIDAVVTQAKEGGAPAPNTLGGPDHDKTKVLMFLSDDESEIRLMEDPHGPNPRYYAFKRLTASSQQR